ncbi:hypothetical protein J4205_00535 [Candidatus Pacearchaeota archaeon]|nr:hypothetical protein [Candidatus Pacearchaeota archaeon]
MKNNNILKYSKIRKTIRKNNLKINKDSLDEINKLMYSLINRVVDNINYNLKISGKKSIKINDVRKAFDQLIKDEKYREI